MAGLLMKTLRTVDILARYGGDELIIVMPHTDIVGAELLCERLHIEIERQMPFTVSIGVASASDADTPQCLFKRADAALYRARMLDATACSAITAQSAASRRANTGGSGRMSGYAAADVAEQRARRALMSGSALAPPTEAAA